MPLLSVVTTLLSLHKRVAWKILIAIITWRNFPFRGYLLKFSGLRDARVYSISSSINERITDDLMCGSKVSIASPSFYDGRAESYTSITGPIRAYCFKDVTASPYSPAIGNGDKLFLPLQVLSGYPRIQTSSGRVFRSSGNRICISAKVDLRIDKGIHAGGAGAFNWYHFIMECLPKVYFAQMLPPEYDSFPLILPKECATIPSFADAVNTLAPSRKLIYLSPDLLARVRELIVFDEISFGPFNMQTGEWPSINDYFQHDRGILQFILAFRESTLNDGDLKQKNKRIFLARSGKRRKYNQDDLIEIARRYGFVPVMLDKLSLQEQARLFSEASMIVGPSGAAWTGMIFCSERIIGLSWLPCQYREFCSYSTLAHLLGHQLSFIEAKTMQPLHSTGDAYTAEYKVDLDEFENALAALARSACP